MPTRLITTSIPVRSWPSARGSCTFAATSSTVSSTRSRSPCAGFLLGTRTQCPARASRVTSSVPTKPVPPSTQMLKVRGCVFNATRSSAGAAPAEADVSTIRSPAALASAQRYPQDRVAPADFEHQHRGALRAFAQLLHAGDAPTVCSDDDIVVAQAGLRGRAPWLDVAHERAGSIRCIRQSGSLEALVDSLGGGPRLGGGGRVGDDRRDAHRLAIAQQPDLDLVSDPHQPDGVAQLAVGLDRLAVHRRDDIPGMDAGFLRR